MLIRIQSILFSIKLYLLFIKYFNQKEICLKLKLLLQVIVYIVCIIFYDMFWWHVLRRQEDICSFATKNCSSLGNLLTSRGFAEHLTGTTNKDAHISTALWYIGCRTLGQVLALHKYTRYTKYALWDSCIAAILQLVPSLKDYEGTLHMDIFYKRVFHFIFLKIKKPITSWSKFSVSVSSTLWI